MNNGYFAQYLLNEGLLETEEIGGLLEKSVKTAAGRPMVALRKGYLTPEQLETLPVEGESEDFLHHVAEQGMLSAARIEELRSAVTDHDLNLAQVLFNEKRMTFAEIKEHFNACDGLEVSPVRQLVLDRAFKAELLMEAEYYADFTELFVRSLTRFMETPVVVNTREPIPESAELSHIVSQRLIGDMKMVTGLHARDEVFLEMARRYSHEDITAVDELAVDSLCEFINVINGLFAVDMASREIEIDLDLPRVSENSFPDGNLQLVLLLETGFGKFVLILAGDEFVLRAAKD